MSQARFLDQVPIGAYQSQNGTSESSSFATTASYALTASNLQGGTPNYIAIWNTATTLSSSILYQTSSNVGIGTTTPTQKLDVNGNVLITGSFNQASASRATGLFAHAQGLSVTASGQYSHAEGLQTTANGAFSHAEGFGSETSGSYSHAEGTSTSANGSYSHAEGASTSATGNGSHAEGQSTLANGVYSHAEGYGTNALGSYSHTEGVSTTATGQASHAEGYFTTASGDYSHAEGLWTVASGSYQHAQGQYNITSSAQSAFIVGNGTSNASRSNLIFASGSQVQITGSAQITGSLIIQGNSQVSGSLRGQVTALSITSNTASLNMSTNNFFTLTLVNGANTYINPTNINPGQTVNILVSQSSAGTGTVSFPSQVKQASGSLYTGSAVANAVDIITMITFDASTVYVSSIRNLV